MTLDIKPVSQLVRIAWFAALFDRLVYYFFITRLFMKDVPPFESPLKHDRLPRRIEVFNSELLSFKENELIKVKAEIASRHLPIIDFSDGSVYEGETRKGSNREGKGLQICSSGAWYYGTWVNDKYDGRGLYVFPDGQRYKGQFSCGNRHGQGCHYFLDGRIYTGSWVRDKIEGVGEEFNAIRGLSFSGTWRDGVKQGKGVCKLGPHAIAEGVWSQGSLVVGTIQTEEYKGGWKHSSRHGTGRYTYADGGQYTGQWYYGLPHGWGSFQFANGDMYEGQFEFGQKCGKGVYRYSTGDIYEGEYTNGLKHGFGIMLFSNGDRYEGQWERDEFSMSGCYAFSSGFILKDHFKAGKPQHPSRNVSRSRSKTPPKR